MTHDALLVTRGFFLGGADPAAVATALRAAPGVRQLRPARRSLSVTYDLRATTFAEVEAALARTAGIPLAKGFAARLRRRWAAFTEANMLASVRAEVRPCCSQPPGED